MARNVDVCRRAGASSCPRTGVTLSFDSQIDTRIAVNCTNRSVTSGAKKKCITDDFFC